MARSLASGVALLFVIAALAAYVVTLGLFDVPFGALAGVAVVAVGLRAWARTREA